MSTLGRLLRRPSVLGGKALFKNQAMFYYVYILKSQKDNNLYVGYTDNLKRRKLEHDNVLVKATCYRKPLELVYYEACVNKQKAIAREKYFKTGFGRRYLKQRI